MNQYNGDDSSPKSSRTEWQLPQGVPKGAWDYSQTESIASDYDDYFQDHALLAFDQSLLSKWFAKPGVVFDFGCGTGRALVKLLESGKSAVGVDLSQPMLTEAQSQLARFTGRFSAVRANLVELDCIADQSADYAICLFSTLGMIQGHDNRIAALAHMRRILKPGGLLVLHVHNFWFNLYDPGGPWWLLKSLFAGRESRGDKTYDYRGIRDFYLHVFGRRELQRIIGASNLKIRDWIPLRTRCDGPLPLPWFVQSLRASGWIVCCERPQ
ncbi:class I SAM-dependent methyltransferase [Planctomycetota bacterium]